ncbi:hypothetical protein [Rhizobium leucaenae]|uniref:Uncharacterized protein n=1 Tax=Rhizobium leucaenae TaxID=29450 RepID=A0A7W7EIT9_9HYPH|nr:hypothetical protein [Rhizobium leucaenae]MBB4566744.1 hypothetical protein [Rhizobium leucaenae]MBB6301362.1 hypothetical protein [Rhizobium leucaenae]
MKDFDTLEPPARGARSTNDTNEFVARGADSAAVQLRLKLASKQYFAGRRVPQRSRNTQCHAGSTISVLPGSVWNSRKDDGLL